MMRFILAAILLMIAVAVLPYSLLPIFNTADVILVLIPFVIVLIWLAPAVDRWVIEDIEASHPDSLGSLDLMEPRRLPPESD